MSREYGEINLLEDETLEDLDLKGLYIIQKKHGFRFGIDAVLLSDFIRVDENEKMLDLCTGTGIIPILVYGKQPCRNISALDIQGDFVEMAKRAAVYNKIEDSVKFYEGDVKNIDEYFKPASFNVVSCNPPYIKSNSGLVNPSDTKAVARHEILCNIFHVAKAASRVLKSKGRFYLIHRPDRLTDIMLALVENRLEPKRIQFIKSYNDEGPVLVMIEAVKDGGRWLKYEPSLVLYGDRKCREN